ncbi:hypothetical protein Lser_V15G15974 [Lactuca serriola]
MALTLVITFLLGDLTHLSSCGGFLDGVTAQNFNSVKEVIDFVANWGYCPKKMKLLIVIIYGALCNVWKARNDRLFKQRVLHPLRRWWIT